MNMSFIQCVLISLVLSISYIHLVSGQQCLNVTSMKCNVNQVMRVENNCTKCVCRPGSYHQNGLGGCLPCDRCDYPKIIVKECSETSNSQCGVCKETYYRSKEGCRKCQKCEYGVLQSCGKYHDTICIPKTTMPPTTRTEKTTITLKLTNRSKLHDGSGKDWRTKPIWAILFIIALIVIVVLILMLCFICRNSVRRASFVYTPTDAGSLATSLSSLLFTKSKLPDITCLTEEERCKLLSKLPGGYAELLAQLLNPNAPNNWVHLAYEFNATQIHVANLKNSSEPTQDLLLHLCSMNTTVERLWKALKNIKRDDACVRFINFILNLRKDDESAILLID